MSFYLASVIDEKSCQLETILSDASSVNSGSLLIAR